MTVWATILKLEKYVLVTDGALSANWRKYEFLQAKTFHNKGYFSFNCDSFLFIPEIGDTSGYSNMKWST